jgi:hypothetical protein
VIRERKIYHKCQKAPDLCLAMAFESHHAPQHGEKWSQNSASRVIAANKTSPNHRCVPSKRAKEGNGRVVIAMTASSDTPNVILRCEPSSASLEGCATTCGHPSRLAKRAPQDDDAEPYFQIPVQP